MAEFDSKDLKQTVEDLHANMQAGKNAEQLLQQALGVLTKCAETFERTQGIHQDLAKSVWRLEGEMGYQGERQEQLIKGMSAGMTALLKAMLAHTDPARGTRAPAKAATMGKSRWLSAVKDPEPASVATSPDEDPAQMVKKGMLLQAVSRMFGPRGGREIAYNPELASRLLMENKLTKSEHSNWKKLGRLPDHVQVA